MNQFLFFGDIDESQEGNYTWDYLTTLTKNKFWNINHFFFLGDYAYEFYQSNGTKGDKLL